jgi:hypothetical protein
MPHECHPNQNRAPTKSYDHSKEHGKKAFHFEVAKLDTSYFRFLSSHAHKLKLDTKHFGKFVKFTATLGNNAPMSDCTHLQRCVQGHLNFHLSSTCIMINGIDTLDASELLSNPFNGKLIGRFLLHDLLYRIQLDSKAPLFLQLSQQLSGEVNAVIPNTPEAELMAENMNVQIAAWCHFYWKEINPGAKRFYRKLSDRAFSQVLLHEIMECSWDSSTKSVTSLRAQSEMSAIAEFKQLDWVKSLSQDNASSSNKKRHVDPNLAFPFQDDFSVGTIHGSNLAPTNSGMQPALSETIVIGDEDHDISILTSKTSADSGDPPPSAEEHGSNAAV